jgi:predicted hydrocarbon binding protein
MPPSIDLPSNTLVVMSRDSLLALRSALFRDVGPDAATLLQEAGIAGGPGLYDTFTRWLSDRGYGTPETLAATQFGERASEFFRDAGWGTISVGALDSVATIDSSDWAEGDPNFPLEFPGCYYSTGVFADFFGRLAGEPLAVMEVECRSMGAERCRFLVGSEEVMQKVYDEMGRGVGYQEVVGV